MASNFFSKTLVILSVIFAICFALIPAPVFAASSADNTVRNFTVKFYLDPALVSDMNFARKVLPKYVLDMNTILAKNTNVQLVFDPQTGIIPAPAKPQTDSALAPFPTENFELWVYAKQTSSQLSYGGYAGLDMSGAGVAAGLNWTRLYDPDKLSSNTIQDYSLQINNMLHEFAHVFGAGIGEYYNLTYVTDTTAESPLMNIDLYGAANDPFWSDKPDFMTDPLLRLTYATTRAQYLQLVRYSNLTAAIISGEYRNGIPSFDQFTIRALDANGQPIPQAEVKVWNVAGTSTHDSTLLFDETTDDNGQVSMSWGGLGNQHNATNFLRLIKIYKDGVSLMQPRYISIYDADISKLVARSDSYVVTMSEVPAQPTSEVKDLTSVGGQDGWVLESGRKTNLGGTVNSSATTFSLGDDQNNRQYRSILSFDTSSLPDNAVITKVTLKIKKQGLTGTNPFTAHGNILVDIHKSFFGSAAGLQNNDFQASSSLKKAATLLNAPAADNWYSASLNASAFSFVNLTGVTQLRLEFEKTDSNNRADYLKFFSGNANANSKPVLEIEYTVP